MKIDRKLILNYLKTLAVSAIGVVLIMKFVLKKDLMSPVNMAISLVVLTVLIFLGFLMREHRRKSINKNK